MQTLGEITGDVAGAKDADMCVPIVGAKVGKVGAKVGKADVYFGRKYW